MPGLNQALESHSLPWFLETGLQDCAFIMMITLWRMEPERNIYRWYTLTVTRNLFDEWVLLRQWGRIGHRGGQQRSDWYLTKEEAQASLIRYRDAKIRRGYIVVESL